jgi:hypothetical protein
MPETNQHRKNHSQDREPAARGTRRDSMMTSPGGRRHRTPTQSGREEEPRSRTGSRGFRSSSTGPQTSGSDTHAGRPNTLSLEQRTMLLLFARMTCRSNRDVEDVSWGCCSRCSASPSATRRWSASTPTPR